MSGAKDYAEALFALSEELSITEEVFSDVKICAAILERDPAYAKLVDTPALSVPEKLSLIDKAFASVNYAVLNLLKILCEHHSVHIFQKLAKEYTALYNESRGILNAEAISAVALSESQLAAIRRKLKDMTGSKTVVLKNTIDKSLIGGIKLRYMGKQLDGSLRSRLDTIETSLKNTIL